MPQHPIEVILTRQLSEYLSIPVFLVDPTGDLVFYNEGAERLLGLQFEETGPMPAEVWSRAFHPTDAEGNPLPPEKLPLVRTLRTGRPSMARFFIEALDGGSHEIEVGAWPLLGHGGRNLGAVAMFWKIEQKS